MNGFLASLWVEALKMRRSKVPLFTAIGFSMAPLMGGLFMIILKDPEAARSMGLISAKESWSERLRSFFFSTRGISSCSKQRSWVGSRKK